MIKIIDTDIAIYILYYDVGLRRKIKKHKMLSLRRRNEAQYLSGHCHLI